MMVRLSHGFVGLMKWIAPLFGRIPIEDVSTEDLIRQLNGDGRSIVLVDVRSDEEVNVSLIPGSIIREEFEAHRDEYVGKLVVAYCTVGGRSLLYAQQCVRDGFEAQNYRSGILGWCEAGQPLVTRDGTPTNRVHTHSPVFDVPAGYERVC